MLAVRSNDMEHPTGQSVETQALALLQVLDDVVLFISLARSEELLDFDQALDLERRLAKLRDMIVQMTLPQ